MSIPSCSIGWWRSRTSRSSSGYVREQRNSLLGRHGPERGERIARRRCGMACDGGRRCDDGAVAVVGPRHRVATGLCAEFDRDRTAGAAGCGIGCAAARFAAGGRDKRCGVRRVLRGHDGQSSSTDASTGAATGAGCVGTREAIGRRQRYRTGNRRAPPRTSLRCGSARAAFGNLPLGLVGSAAAAGSSDSAAACAPSMSSTGPADASLSGALKNGLSRQPCAPGPRQRGLPQQWHGSAGMLSRAPSFPARAAAGSQRPSPAPPREHSAGGRFPARMRRQALRKQRLDGNRGVLELHRRCVGRGLAPSERGHDEGLDIEVPAAASAAVDGAGSGAGGSISTGTAATSVAGVAAASSTACSAALAPRSRLPDLERRRRLGHWRRCYIVRLRRSILGDRFSRFGQVVGDRGRIFGVGAGIAASGAGELCSIAGSAAPIGASRASRLPVPPDRAKPWRSCRRHRDRCRHAADRSALRPLRPAVSRRQTPGQLKLRRRNSGQELVQKEFGRAPRMHPASR